MKYVKIEYTNRLSEGYSYIYHDHYYNMNTSNLETLSACYKSLKEIQERLIKVMAEEDKNFDLLPKSDQEGEAGEKLGFEIDALDNIDYLLGEVITFIEENLGDRLS